MEEAALSPRFQRDPETIEGTPNSLLRNTRCCFCFPRFNSNQSPSTAWWKRIRHPSSQQIESDPDNNNNRWWAPAVNAFQKVREWSEIVAGPKWKTFIRRFNRSKSNNYNNNNHHHGKFQYDPLSYSLNFDHSPKYDDDDDDFGGFRDFSSRYASSKSAATTAGDVRGKDVAVFA